MRSQASIGARDPGLSLCAGAHSGRDSGSVMPQSAGLRRTSARLRYNVSREKRVRSGRSTCVGYSTRPGWRASSAATDSDQAIVKDGRRAMPGSSVSGCHLMRLCDVSSHTLRQGASLGDGFCTWLTRTPTWPGDTAGDAAVPTSEGSRCVVRSCNRQALAHAAPSANTQIISIAAAKRRLSRWIWSIFMERA